MAESDPFRLDGRRALITGAGGGIGQALVETFTAAGCAVIAADREMGLLEKLDCAHRVAFDLSEPQAIRAAIGDLEAKSLTPDIFISNAGGARAETFAQVDEEVWANEMQLNLNSAFLLTRLIVDGMIRRGGGAIVYTATVNALTHFGNPAYASAKAGLVALMKSVAVEHGADGIRANAVCPGSVLTHAWERRLQRSPDLRDKLTPHYPLGRLVVPKEVARAALFLASDAASGITGVALPVDAGLTAGNLRFVREVIAP